eukprot:4694492-Pleurochrysis_carterae.AAC.4
MAMKSASALQCFGCAWETVCARACMASVHIRAWRVCGVGCGVGSSGGSGGGAKTRAAAMSLWCR